MIAYIVIAVVAVFVVAVAAPMRGRGRSSANGECPVPDTAVVVDHLGAVARTVASPSTPASARAAPASRTR